ncbi:HAD hydrolase-like protein [Bordetella holmesii]|uniref:Haloacid dehalogenase-like hydrolase n=2 Tax=Bordetella holmesii TaxID=35814 RepID=A0A158M9G6_9BORD|nr:HAD hydrolase-like protein [Bordetella holmesii]AHV94090.1 HAD hydrolase, IA, variant 1 family protein [Bordetella holmesii ATCC 51541]AIT25846.1 HAD hydrolase, IA, variant 1 family protein [Bordetella holmesii 44057]EWM43975.1 HAD hydrolase, IA, variant 1 family protein [Bordetella holmesii 41130]EWM46415.1 HAD hydrolase, IA, variant 1 family protein [Bordetella holmesii 35009]EWM50578.1 HAD hydrolase, IA, variant 1 family protein [Bordetella holmesii 70147]
MKYALVAFDFDGTLADTLPWMESILHDVAEKFSFRKPDAQERLRLRQHSAYEIMKQLGIPLWKAPAILTFVRQAMEDAMPRVALFPGVDAMLRAVHDSGARMAVVSSNSTANVQRVLGPQLTALIADYACGTDLFGKSTKMEHLLRDTQIPPGQAILIGDEIRDIEAARKIGVASGVVAWGYNPEATLREHSPDLVFNDVRDLARSLLPA